MISRRNTCVLILGIMLVATSLLGQTAGSGSVYLPPVSVAPSETVQLNLSNVATVPPSGGPPPWCSGAITFYGAGGLPIVATFYEGAGFPLTPGVDGSLGFGVGGAILSVSLPYSAFGSSNRRATVRVEITVSPIAGPSPLGWGSPQDCKLVTSLEVFDTATGVTHAIVSGSPSPGPKRD